MKAIGVFEYGPISNLQAIDIPHPGKPSGRDLLVKYGFQTCLACKAMLISPGNKSPSKLG